MHRATDERRATIKPASYTSAWIASSLGLFGFLLWFAGPFGCSASSAECGDGIVGAGEQR